MAYVDGMTVMQDANGRLYQVKPEEVATVQRDQKWTVAADNVVQQRVEDRAKYQKYGTTGQQAQGLAETAVRNATLGAVTGFGSEEDNRARAEVVEEESPILNAAAGAAPAVAASVATAGLAGGSVLAGAALEGAAGAYGNLGAATDEAFKRDQELSAENALSAMGTGFLIGAGTHGAFSAASKGVSGVRNRFVEASAKVSREAEAKAAEAVGLVNVDRKVFQAMDNTVEAATLRKAADEARPGFAQDVEKAVSDLDTVAAGTKRSSSSSALDEAFPEHAPTPEGDVTRQAPPLRAIVDDFEKGLPPDSPMRQAAGMWKEDISKAGNDFQGTARRIEKEIETLAEQSRDPEMAKALQETQGHLRDYASNGELFGKEAASKAATRAELEENLSTSRARLGDLMSKHDYSQVVGTRAGRDIEQAASAYADSIKALDPGSAGAVEAAAGKFSAHPAVASGNQVDALLSAPKSVLKGSRTAEAAPDVFKDIAGEVAETAVEAIVPGAGLLRKAWKYRGHIFNLAGDARGKAASAVGQLLQDTAKVAGKGASVARRAATVVASRQAVEAEEAEQYKQMRDSVLLLAKEPERLADALAGQMGDIPEQAPELHMAVAGKAAAAVDFLASKIPPSFTFSLANPEGPPPSRTDVLEMMSYWRGVTDVPGVLVAIGNGSAMPEEVESFQAVYPAWYSEFQEGLSMRLQEKARQGYVIPGMRIAQLDALLDLGSSLDITFSDEVAGIAQAADEQKQQAQKAPSYTPAPKAGARTQNATLSRVQGHPVS